MLLLSSSSWASFAAVHRAPLSSVRNACGRNHTMRVFLPKPLLLLLIVVKDKTPTGSSTACTTRQKTRKPRAKKIMAALTQRQIHQIKSSRTLSFYSSLSAQRARRSSQQLNDERKCTNMQQSAIVAIDHGCVDLCRISSTVIVV